MTGEIFEIVKRYIEKPNTDYALMISGEWGSGKTFFWKNKLVPQLQEIKNPETNKKYKCLYVSLNGVTELSQITSQVIAAKIPGGQNKILRNLRDMGMSVIEVATTVAFISNYTGQQSWNPFKRIQLHELLNFRNCILCFDDLERKSKNLGIDEVLGHINTTYVEHAGIKTVIITDEKQIDENEKEHFHARKEKVIGRIIPFDASLVSIDDIFDRYKTESEFFSFLQRNRDFLIQLRDEFSISNLRTFFFILDTINTVISSITPEISGDIEQQLIFFSMAISREFKEGILSASDAKKTHRLEKLNTYTGFDIERWTSSLKEGEEAPYHWVFAKKYLEFKYIDDYFFYNSIYTFILSGYFDEKLFEGEAILSKKKFQALKEDPAQVALKKLFEYSTLEEEELKSATEQVIKFARDGKFPFYDYMSIWYLLQSLSQNHLTTYNQGALEDIIRDGYSRSIKNVVLFGPQFGDIKERLQKFPNETLKGWIERDIAQLENEKEKSYVDEFFVKLQTDPDEFSKSFSSMNIFRRLSAEEIARRIKEFDVKTMIRFTNYIGNLLKGMSPTEIEKFHSSLTALPSEIRKLKSNLLVTEEFRINELSREIEKFTRTNS